MRESSEENECEEEREENEEEDKDDETQENVWSITGRLVGNGWYSRQIEHQT